MHLEWDEAKNEHNIRERGIPFEFAADFAFETALFVIEPREKYGEPRMRALGFLGERLHVLVFAMRGESLRVISLRKANAREVRKHAQSYPAEPGKS